MALLATCVQAGQEQFAVVSGQGPQGTELPAPMRAEGWRIEYRVARVREVDPPR